MNGGWMKTTPAAGYYGVSIRTFREWLKRGFPCSRSPTGSIVVELAAGNEWLRERSVQTEGERLNQVADDILENF